MKWRKRLSGIGFGEIKERRDVQRRARLPRLHLHAHTHTHTAQRRGCSSSSPDLVHKRGGGCVTRTGRCSCGCSIPRLIKRVLTASTCVAFRVRSRKSTYHFGTFSISSVRNCAFHCAPAAMHFAARERFITVSYLFFRCSPIFAQLL